MKSDLNRAMVISPIPVEPTLIQLVPGTYGFTMKCMDLLGSFGITDLLSIAAWATFFQAPYRTSVWILMAGAAGLPFALGVLTWRITHGGVHAVNHIDAVVCVVFSFAVWLVFMVGMVPLQFDRTIRMILRWLLSLGGIGIVLALLQSQWLASLPFWLAGVPILVMIAWSRFGFRNALTVGSPFRVPFLVIRGGRWFINHHNAMPKQRHALDLVIVPHGDESIDAATLGADILSPVRGTIIAAHDSTVTSELYPAAGNYIIVQMENGTELLLAHLQKGSVQVVVGNAVDEGQLVGRCGSTGNSTGPHLHIQANFGNSKNSKTIPLRFRKTTLIRAGKRFDGSERDPRRNDILEPRVPIIPYRQ